MDHVNNREATGGCERQVVPLAEESLDVGKRQVAAGGVRVRTSVRQWEKVIDEPLKREEVNVQRVPINRWVDSPPQVRIEGDTTIVPEYEEVLVVEKRLILRAEVRITRKVVEHRSPQRFTLRREEAQIERTEPPDPAREPSSDRQESGPKT
jgi:uncharacterized protein (TIGR02271 family)